MSVKEERPIEVRNILDMWLNIESSYTSLADSEKEVVREAVSLLRDPKFRGFDLNDSLELKYYKIIKSIIESDNNYVVFKKRLPFGLRSHRKILPHYRRMLKVYKKYESGKLTPDMLIAILSCSPIIPVKFSNDS